MMSYDFQPRPMSISISGQMDFQALPRTNERWGAAIDAPAPAGAQITLSRRQEDVLRLLVQGLPNKEIARVLEMGQGTVKVHMTALLHKLGVSSRTAAAVIGARLLAAKAAPAPSPKPGALGTSHLFGPVTFTA